jgi:hypothetical protein
MTWCGRCGSIGARIVKAEGIERILTALLRQQMVYCGRCGWRGRRRIAGPASIQPWRPRHARTTGEQSVGVRSNEPDLAEIDRAVNQPGDAR